MSLDSRARVAAESLLRATASTDTDAAMRDLMRLRSRRAGERAVAAGLCVALVVLGVWAIVRPGASEEPAPVRPVQVYNGTLVVGPEPLPGMRDEAVDQATLPVAPLPRWVSRAAWSPDGTRLAYAVRGKRVEVLDLRTGVVTPIRTCGYYCFDLSWSVQDEIALSEAARGSAWIEFLTPDGESRGRLRVPGLEVAGGSWSPDGTRLAIGGRPEGTKNEGIYVVNRDGSGATRIASLAKDHDATEVHWSPDGTGIAVLEVLPHSKGWAYRLMMALPDGTAYEEVTELGWCYCLGWSPPSVAWAPDGTVLAARRIYGGSNGSPAIVTMRPDGSDQDVVGTGNRGPLAWQPVPAG